MPLYLSLSKQLFDPASIEPATGFYSVFASGSGIGSLIHIFWMRISWATSEINASRTMFADSSVAGIAPTALMIVANSFIGISTS